MMYFSGVSGLGSMNTQGKADSANRMAHKKKGGNPFSPKYMAIKLIPHKIMVSRANSKCTGLILVDLFIFAIFLRRNRWLSLMKTGSKKEGYVETNPCV